MTCISRRQENHKGPQHFISVGKHMLHLRQRPEIAAVQTQCKDHGVEQSPSLHWLSSSTTSLAWPQERSELAHVQIGCKQTQCGGNAVADHLKSPPDLWTMLAFFISKEKDCDQRSYCRAKELALKSSRLFPHLWAQPCRVTAGQVTKYRLPLWDKWKSRIKNTLKTDLEL